MVAMYYQQKHAIGRFLGLSFGGRQDVWRSRVTSSK